MLLAVPEELLQLCCGLLRQGAGGPDLAVRMGVGAAHGSTLVLEDLHVPVLLLGLGETGVRCSGLDVGRGRILSQWRLGRQVRSIDLSPCVDHRDNLDRGQVGEGEVVRGGEGQDVALASNGFGLEETRFKIYMQLVHCRMGWKEHPNCAIPSPFAPS